ncbi:MAG TPA: APC family permease, partial [Acidimicrobiales bacterium]|nr:APC family permease [Acidimicrobiales bacterium]
TKVIALAVFSSDAISSTAYAAEEILFVTAAAGSSLALGLTTLVPIAIAVAFLLAIVVTSYRQTIFAYPSGGGSYVVSRENLGEVPAMLAGASLLVDYILTVAVSISAGVAALISIPALRSHIQGDRVLLCLLMVAIITVANLRGIKESGRIFAVPTYIYIVILTVLVVWGLGRVYVPSLFGGHIGHITGVTPAEGINRLGGTLTLFIILKGFSSGAVALTGVEAISNGVPAFQRPESKNAATTLVWMGMILGVLFFGTAVLAHHLHPIPSHDETVFSQMGRTVMGKGPLYVLLQFATAAILTLAANTAYADFPRLSSIIAHDGYLPRQFATRGDRLVFSNGILILAGAAATLLVGFGGKTDRLIALYAVGVFTSFTLSQAGMVRHHLKEREPAWRRGVAVNATGSAATFVVLMIVAITKFTEGAYIVIIIVPIVMLAFWAVKRYYTRVTAALAITPEEVRPESDNSTVVVLVGRVHRGVIKALRYAKSMRPNHIAAVYVAYEDGDTTRIEQEWRDFGIDVPLEIVHSPYRELVDAVVNYLDELDDRWGPATTTVVIPEFVVGHWYEQALHNQSALAIKLALLFREGTVVASVPYHVGKQQPSKVPPVEALEP